MSSENNLYLTDSATPPQISKTVLPGAIGETRVKRRRLAKPIASNNALSDPITNVEQDLWIEPSVVIQDLDLPFRPLITLQSWVGIVDSIDDETFTASIEDKTDPHNPLEEVVLPIEEISTPDLGLLAVGAPFYWKIGYRTTPSGQRERVSTIRFARLAKISEQESERLSKQAEELAAYLSDDVTCAQV